jgi:fibronectin type 3 domain-containing protein
MDRERNLSFRSQALRLFAMLLVFASCGESYAKSHSVTLTWDASTSTVIGYNVYRTSRKGGPREKITTKLVTGTRYVDSSVKGGHIYTYVVTSVDARGNESRPTDPITAAVPSR